VGAAVHDDERWLRHTSASTTVFVHGLDLRWLL